MCVRGDCAQAVFLPLEESVADLLVADAGLEGSFGRREVGDDVRNIFFDTDLLIGLIGRDNYTC